MDNKIKLNLEKQFGKLTDQEAAPDELKEEVFQTLEQITEGGDMPLYTTNNTDSVVDQESEHEANEQDAL